MAPAAAPVTAPKVKFPSAPRLVPVPLSPPRAVIDTLDPPICTLPKLKVVAAPPDPVVDPAPPEPVMEPLSIDCPPVELNAREPAAPPSPPVSPAPPLTSTPERLTSPAVEVRLKFPPAPPLPPVLPSPPARLTFCTVTLVPVIAIVPPLDPGPEAGTPIGVEPCERIDPLTLTAPALLSVRLPASTPFAVEDRSAPPVKVIPFPAPVVVMVRLLPVVVKDGVITIGPATVKLLPLFTLNAAPLVTVSPVSCVTLPPKFKIPPEPPSNVRLCVPPRVCRKLIFAPAVFANLVVSMVIAPVARVTGPPRFTAPPAVKMFPFNVVAPPPLVTVTAPKAEVVPTAFKPTVAPILTGLIVKSYPVNPLATAIESIAPLARKSPERLLNTKFPPMFTVSLKVTPPAEVTVIPNGFVSPTAP